MAIPIVAAQATAPRRVHFAWAALVYLALVVYGSLVPLQFRAMPLGEAWEQLSRAPHVWGIESRTDFVANILLLVPLSYLLMGWFSVDRGRAARVAAALVVVPLCVLAGASIELVQAFFPPRTVSLGDVLAESLGALVGVSLWLAAGEPVTRWCRRLWAARRTPGAGRRLVRPAVAVLAVVLWLGVLATTHWYPFDFRADWALAGQRLGRISWLPFADYYWQSAYNSFDQFLQKTLLFAILGGLLALLAPAGERTFAGLLVIAAVVAVAVVLEAGQLFLPSRYPGFTDVLIETCGGLLGLVAVRSFGTIQYDA